MFLYCKMRRRITFSLRIETGGGQKLSYIDTPTAKHGEKKVKKGDSVAVKIIK